MMGLQEARQEIRERYLELDPEQFEEFTKILTEEVEGPAYIRLTPFRGDDGLDLEGDIGHEFVDAKFGAQVKLHRDNIGSRSIRTFVGSLDTNNCQVGCYITSSNYRDSAIDAANSSSIPLTLLDGDDILDIMLRHEIGVTVPDSEDHTTVEVDQEFWEIFREPETTDTIPSGEVPQADNFGILHLVLMSIDHGRDTKHEIARYVKNERGDTFDPRQADYYGMAGWLLGFVHKDQRVDTDQGSNIRRWGLTRKGEEYLVYLDDHPDQAREILHEAIRDMEVINRVYDVLKNEGTVTRRDIADVLADETELSGSTTERRAQTVGLWLQELPEVHASGSGMDETFEYIEDDLDDF